MDWNSIWNPTFALMSSRNDIPEGWKEENDQLKRSFRFNNFKEAMAAMIKIAFEAEAMNHHPNWSNVYNQLDISLSTHDAGNKVTMKDIELAKRINEIVI